MATSEKQIALLSYVIHQAFKPDPILTVSEWADANRILSTVASAEPGQWRTARTPYLKEILDCLSAVSTVQEVVFIKGSQIGATETGLNWIGYAIDHMPGPMMVVQPTDGLAKRFSKQRLDPLLRETPALQHKVRAKKSRDSSNTAQMKEYDGGILVISGANSAVALRSLPIRYLFLDEIDGYPDDVDEEGDPVKLAEARCRTFSRRKIYKCSTPTIKNRSRIEYAYTLSDQRVFLVPCPHCKFMQEITWAKIKWEKRKPQTAMMVCESCDTKIEEHFKTFMLDQGKWVAKNPDSDIAGFFLSSLYSPLGWYSWRDAAKEFLDAKDSPVLLRVFVNTVLGETWAEKGDSPEWKRLFERREQYAFNVVPKGALFLTAGIDVQKNRFEVMITAWGRDKQSWVIDYRVIECDPFNEKSYAALDSILNETFHVEQSRVTLSLRLAAIDSGYATQHVYNYTRNKPNRVIAIKGNDTQQVMVRAPSFVDTSYAGKKISKGGKVWSIGTSLLKTELYGWLKLDKPTAENEPYPPGFCHHPELGEEFFKGLCGEQIVARRLRGFTKYVWEKIYERNEPLDAFVYSRAAAAVVGLDKYRDEDWEAMEKAITDEAIAHGPITADRKKSTIVTKKSSFWE